MKINWKVRFKNPVFLTQLGLAILMPILAYYGIAAADLTTWASLWEILVKAVSNPYVVATIAVSIWNALNDPTVKGVGDSEQALEYEEPKDDSKD